MVAYGVSAFAQDLELYIFVKVVVWERKRRVFKAEWEREREWDKSGSREPGQWESSEHFGFFYAIEKCTTAALACW